MSTQALSLVTRDDPKNTVREYIIENLFLGANIELGDDASLLDAGALDSTAAMELVSFLQNTFAIEIEGRDISPDNLETVNRILALIDRKLGRQPAV